MKTEFDLIIIGGGAGGFAAAIRANELGVSTALINSGLPLGGTCVNVGCVPSKTLLWVSEMLHQANHNGIEGVETEVKKFDFAQVIDNELVLVDKLRQEKYEKVVKRLKLVTLIKGRAKFISQNKVQVKGRTLTAKKFIIATGSTATIPPIPGLKQVGFITHIEALRLKKQPKSLIVIGAGPLGIEFGQMFARFGTKVTILQKGDSILPFAEKELTDRLHEILTNEGMVIKTGVRIKAVNKIGGQKRIIFDIKGQPGEVAAEEILLAAGKTPNTKDLGLDKVQVEIDKNQAIVVNQYFQTSNPDIFAVGDVIKAPLRLETTAGREGSLAAENALGDANYSFDYQSVPYTVFTDPQLAGVGLTEKKQIKQTGACACRSLSFDKLPKALITGRTEGMIKMIIDPKTKQILGVHILAPDASDLIAQAMVIIKNKNTINDIIDSLPVFPSFSEAIKLTAMSFTRDITHLSCCV